MLNIVDMVVISKYNILIKLRGDFVKIIGERLKELWTGVLLLQTQIGKMFSAGQSNIFKYELGTTMNKRFKETLKEMM